MIDLKGNTVYDAPHGAHIRHVADLESKLAARDAEIKRLQSVVDGVAQWHEDDSSGYDALALDSLDVLRERFAEYRKGASDAR